MKFIRISTAPKNYFRCVGGSLQISLYAWSLKTRMGLVGKFIDKLIDISFKYIWSMMALVSSKKGSFIVDGLGDRSFSFNGSNTQYSAIYAEQFKGYGYEPCTTTLIRHFLKKSTVFIDVGSNWGYFSLVAAFENPSCHIHAFEPFPSARKDLDLMVEQFSLRKSIRVYPYALSDKNLKVSMDTRYKSGLAKITESSENIGSGVSVDSRSLDGFNNLNSDLIKIDVEGYESRVIEGATGHIQKNKPIIIFESTVSGAFGKILHPFICLEKLGYEFYYPCMLINSSDGFEMIMEEAEFTHHSVDYHGPATVVLLKIDYRVRAILQGNMNFVAIHPTKIDFLN
jgi:FkbM family methyltransferase